MDQEELESLLEKYGDARVAEASVDPKKRRAVTRAKAQVDESKEAILEALRRHQALSADDDGFDPGPYHEPPRGR